MSDGRVVCVCGRSAAAENWQNHRLRKTNGPHRAANAPDPETGLTAEETALLERLDIYASDNTLGGKMIRTKAEVRLAQLAERPSDDESALSEPVR